MSPSLRPRALRPFRSQVQVLAQVQIQAQAQAQADVPVQAAHPVPTLVPVRAHGPSRPRRIAAVLALVTATASVLATGSAGAAGAEEKSVEAQARALQKKAMLEDYLATEFDKAQDKLTQAVNKCSDKCSVELRAELRRDLGVVQIGGQIDKDRGLQNWTEALRLNRNLKLDADVKTKELEKLFEDLRKGVGGGAAGANAGAQPPAGDFTHTPVPQQEARTSVPIFVEYGGSEAVVRVIAKYKAVGMTEWKSVELKKLQNGYGGLVPCVDILPGELAYYVQGFNAETDPVATSGNRQTPFRVTIVSKLEGEAPHLPGQAAPKKCDEPASGDCPPDFPGCKGQGAAGGAAASSGSSSTTGRKQEGSFCDSGSECESGLCRVGQCAAPSKPRHKRLWVGVAGSFDFDFVPSATSVCKLSKDGTVNSGYYCADGDGNDYPARPGADPTGKQNDGMGTKLGNVINGGTVFANTRLQLTVDYALTQQLLLGGRVGLVLGTYKGQAAKDEGAAFPIPLHLEVRGSYLLHPEGVDAVLSPMVMVGAGVAPTDAKVDVYVYDGVTSPGPNETGGVKKTFQAWRSTGPVFATLGLGGRYVLGSQMAIYALPLKANLAFPNNGAMFGISPELGIQVGF